MASGTGFSACHGRSHAILPTGGSSRPVGLTFGSNTQVGQVWNTDPVLALTINRNPTDKYPYYWRAVTYDQIDTKGWKLSTTATTDRDTGTSLFGGMADDVDPATHRTFTFTVTPADFNLPTIVSPQTPVAANQDTKLQTVGGTGRFGILERDGGSGAYTVTAMVPIDGNDPGQLNESALRQTTTNYPDDIKALYLGVAEGSLGPEALKLKAKILSLAESDAPYDIARAAVKELQSSDFKYAVDIRDVRCESLSVVECFATYKKGFCQYYAATMAVILRDLDIPTRIAEGFLPGSMDNAFTTERIQNNNAHAWVEVYFPGYGWVTFDPTSPDVAQLAPLPSGPPAASASPRPSVSAGPAASPFLQDERDPGPTGAFTGAGIAPTSDRCSSSASSSSSSSSSWRSSPGAAVRGARPARTGHMARSSGSHRGSGSRHGPPRPSTSTRRRSVRSCPTSGRNCRQSRGPRSRRPTRAAS